MVAIIIFFERMKDDRGMRLLYKNVVIENEDKI